MERWMTPFERRIRMDGSVVELEARWPPASDIATGPITSPQNYDSPAKRTIAPFRAIVKRTIPKRSVSEEVMARAQAEMEKDPALSKSGALTRVFKNDPKLYESYKYDSAGVPSSQSQPIAAGTSVRATVFLGRIEHYKDTGLSPADAVRAATKEDPDGRRAYNLTAALGKEGLTLANQQR